MSKFEMPTPKPKKHRGESNQVAIRLDQDLVKPFRATFDESGVSLNTFVNAMIRHCLKDLGKAKD